MYIFLLSGTEGPPPWLEALLKDSKDGKEISNNIYKPDSKETELGSNDQETSPSTGKNTGVLLVPCRTWKCVPTAISGGVNVSEVPECYLLRQMSSQ